MIMNASWMAWPWFCETVEIRTPMPSVTSRNRAAPRAKVATLPVNGTPNRPIPISTIAVRSTAATIRYGAILPAITSLARSGITASCSSVPVCRSLTTPRLVISVPTNTRMRPARPGTITQEVVSLGL